VGPIATRIGIRNSKFNIQKGGFAVLNPCGS